MASFYLIIPIALIFCLIAIVAWLWANRNGQYDDLEREGRRIFEEQDNIHICAHEHIKGENHP
jgi:cbb3-type cytochrome oxidase maturation protein